MKTVRFLSLTIFLCAALIPLASRWLSAQDPPARAPDGQAEAEALYRLAEFVEWPSERDANGRTTFNFCVLGRDPFGGLLDDVVLGHPIGEKPSVIVRGSQFEDVGRCNVLFISSSEDKRLPRILRRVGDKNILTVSEATDFAGNGGVIQFLKDDNRIRFVINVDAAQRAGLRIRAQLLSLAKVVHNGEFATKE
ncbi:MAG TPA: YfiR family protein [Candidatus Acidoferrales bacterium]|nr:YfiR family protein [Candidatus Acidoferrales bacterium]